MQPINTNMICTKHNHRTNIKLNITTLTQKYHLNRTNNTTHKTKTHTCYMAQWHETDSIVQ